MLASNSFFAARAGAFVNISYARTNLLALFSSLFGKTDFNNKLITFCYNLQSNLDKLTE